MTLTTRLSAILDLGQRSLQPDYAPDRVPLISPPARCAPGFSPLVIEERRIGRGWGFDFCGGGGRGMGGGGGWRGEGGKTWRFGG